MRFSTVLTMIALLVAGCLPLSPGEVKSNADTLSRTPLATTTLEPSSSDGVVTPVVIPAPVVVAPEITTLKMVNEIDGWGMTKNAIVRTNDGGETWYNVSPLNWESFGSGTGNEYFSTTDAWVLASDYSDPETGTLFRTQDGGLTWQSILVPFNSGKLAFLDSENGWAMANLGVGAGSMGVAVYQTIDGGLTWEQVFTNDPNLPNSSDSLPLGGLKNSFVPLNMQIAFIGGVIYAPDTFYFYRTIDSGHTWVAQNFLPAPGIQNSEISIDSGPFFTSEVDAIIPIRFSGESSRTGFYVTHDAGESWDLVTILPGSGLVDFVSPVEGFFWTGESFFITTDAGNTWASVSPNILFEDDLVGMEFIDGNTGWVWTYDSIGQYRLYKTVDAGATWHSLEN